jgi:acyl carrier protein
MLAEFYKRTPWVRGNCVMTTKSVANIEEELLQWCNSRFRASEPITAETDLLDAGYLDSLLVMDLVALMEKDYGAVIDTDELSPQNFRSVKTLSALVAQHSAAKSE